MPSRVFLLMAINTLIDTWLCNNNFYRPCILAFPYIAFSYKKILLYSF